MANVARCLFMIIFEQISPMNSDSNIDSDVANYFTFSQHTYNGKRKSYRTAFGGRSVGAFGVAMKISMKIVRKLNQVGWMDNNFVYSRLGPINL